MLAVAHPCASTFSYLYSQFLANSRSDLHATFFATLFLLRKEFAAKILFLESFGGFGKGVGEILWKAADVPLTARPCGAPASLFALGNSQVALSNPIPIIRPAGCA